MEPMAVGVMMSVGWTLDQLDQIRNLGFTNVQIAAPPEDVLEDQNLSRALIDGILSVGIEVTTVFAGFSGESYDDMPTIRKTVGYLNAATREGRIKATGRISNFARRLGVDKVAAHIGFVPEKPDDPAYRPMVEAVGRVADGCGQNGQIFSLETGQESAPALLRYLKDLGRENVKVNFDPANMILYGSGEPIEALGVLADHVVSVHAKDAKGNPNRGETPLGQGDVGMDRYVARLKQIGYDGPITMEREIPDWDQKVEDLVEGKKLLESLT